MTVDLAALTAAVEAGDRAAAALTEAALDDGTDPRRSSSDDRRHGPVGRRFQDGEIFVPEMLISARAMKAGTAILEPALVAAGVTPEFTAVVGTVEGDLHDIGKNLVGMMWKGAGFEVVDLGVNVPAARFVEAAREHDAQIVGLSALLTTTMPNMRGVVEAVRAAGLRPRSSSAAPRPPPSSRPRSAPTARPPTPGPPSTWPVGCWPADEGTR